MSSYRSLMVYGTSSSGRVRSELPSWTLRTGSWSLRTLGESSPAPRFSSTTDFSSCALQLALERLYWRYHHEREAELLRLAGTGSATRTWPKPVPDKRQT